MIELIVELNVITSVTALSELLSTPGVDIKYYYNSNFHSKLYIFGNDWAIAGSANLTGSGIATNNEVCVRVTPVAHPVPWTQVCLTQRA